MDERHRWENRYAQAEEPFYGREPSPFLVRSMQLLPEGGRCLDLGGGEGRNAVFLAGRGYRVTLVDVAVAGVVRASRAAREDGVKLDVVAADLRASPLGPPTGRWNLILAINYHDREAIASAQRSLRPGGALVVEGFAKEQLGRPSGGPPDADLLWGPNELLELTEGLRVVWYEDRLVADDDNPRHRGPKWVVRLVARRRMRR